ncbi:MAG: UDP-3-O-(3-hydroxymyristoyl)glucosamine N-acyltransferase [Ignavibacteriales bacterium]|nr:UDP-3-O-(3-hydroxymyristoyl)glucosamine N-acyltransferase [Ignavibacteriales bacterium]
MTAQEIATLFEGEIVGDPNVEIRRVAKIEEAGAGDLTFFANPKYEKYIASTKATAILVSSGFDPSRLPASRLVFIKVPDPYIAFLQILKRITPMPDPFPKGIHATSLVPTSAKLGSGVSLGAHVVLGENVVVGSNTKIGPGCVLGDGSSVGEESVIYPNVSIYHGCQIGSRVILHAGVVVGSDGFGFAPKKDGTYEKIPQLGIVVIEDDVELGANCTIDRATIGQTLLKRGVKLDNMVHIAHNVVVGENTVIAAQSGISGSTKVGKNVVIAGQVGIVGHIEIGDRSVLMAQSGIPKSTEPGKAYFGTPAKEHLRALKIEAVIRSLPELAKDIEELKRSLEELRNRLSEPRP